MKRSSSACLALVGAALLLSSPVEAGVFHYYYDPLGRVMGETTTNFLNRIGKNDAADNPTYVHVFGSDPPTAKDTLSQYGVLVAEQSLTSGDGRFTATLQDDGEFVVLQGSTQLWSSGTGGNQPGYINLGGDGNLVLKGPDDGQLWATNTGGNSNASLVMQSDGNLCLYNSSHQGLWCSGTGGH